MLVNAHVCGRHSVAIAVDRPRIACDVCGHQAAGRRVRARIDAGRVRRQTAIRIGKQRIAVEVALARPAALDIAVGHDHGPENSAGRITPDDAVGQRDAALLSGEYAACIDERAVGHQCVEVSARHDSAAGEFAVDHGRYIGQASVSKGSGERAAGHCLNIPDPFLIVDERTAAHRLCVGNGAARACRVGDERAANDCPRPPRAASRVRNVVAEGAVGDRGVAGDAAAVPCLIPDEYAAGHRGAALVAPQAAAGLIGCRRVAACDRKAIQDRVGSLPADAPHDMAMPGSVNRRGLGSGGAVQADRLAQKVDGLTIGARSDENLITRAGRLDGRLDAREVASPRRIDKPDRVSRCHACPCQQNDPTPDVYPPSHVSIPSEKAFLRAFARATEPGPYHLRCLHASRIPHNGY